VRRPQLYADRPVYRRRSRRRRRLCSATADKRSAREGTSAGHCRAVPTSSLTSLCLRVVKNARTFSGGSVLQLYRVDHAIYDRPERPRRAASRPSGRPALVRRL